jgi:hypothetical protein
LILPKNNYGKVLKTMLRERVDFRQNTLKSWGTDRATGLHPTAGDIDAKLAQLEQANDVDPPALNPDRDAGRTECRRAKGRT